MASNKFMKIGLLAVFSVLVLAWAVSGTYSTVLTGTMGAYAEPLPAAGSPDDYVGSETCKACHEDQFNKVSHTKHGRLKDAPDWKNKAEGCESCHGPGKAHVEGGGDKTKFAFDEPQGKILRKLPEGVVEINLGSIKEAGAFTPGSASAPSGAMWRR